MRKYFILAALAALTAGCGQKEESALADAPTMPAPVGSAAKPAADMPATASSAAAPATESPSAAARKGLGPKHAFNAGVNTMMARDVCKLPAGDVAKFTAYSKWLVNDDPEMAKAYLLGARKTAEFYTATAKQRELKTLEQKVCPGVKDMLAMISRGIKTTRPPVGQAAITQ